MFGIAAVIRETVSSIISDTVYGRTDGAPERRVSVGYMRDTDTNLRITVKTDWFLFYA
jgi:hypothetical protein